MVKYFVEKKTGSTSTWIDPIYQEAVINRQLKQSCKIFWMCSICFFGFILLGMVNKYAGYLLFPAIAGWIIFGLRATFKFFKSLEFKDDFTARSTIEAVDSFKGLFGTYPHKLGMKGTAKCLVKQAKQVLALKGNDYEAREILKKMYDSAKALMPVNRYEEIFSAAEAGREIPSLIPQL